MLYQIAGGSGAADKRSTFIRQKNISATECSSRPVRKKSSSERAVPIFTPTDAQSCNFQDKHPPGPSNSGTFLGVVGDPYDSPNSSDLATIWAKTHTNCVVSSCTLAIQSKYTSQHLPTCQSKPWSALVIKTTTFSDLRETCEFLREICGNLRAFCGETGYAFSAPHNFGPPLHVLTNLRAALSRLPLAKLL